VNAREGVACALADCVSDLRPNEERAWRDLLVDEAPVVRRSALASLRSLAQVRPADAVALALSTRFDGEARREAHLVRELCMLIVSMNDEGSLNDEVLDDAAVRAILMIVGQANSIQDHWIRQFVACAAQRCPADTVRMLIRRVEAEKGWGGEYEALPFESLRQELSHLTGCADYEAIVRELIELATQPQRFCYRAARLFRDIAPLDMGTTERLLRERMDRRDPKDVQLVANLLGALPATVLTEHVRLLATVLQAARAIGRDSFASVEDAMREAFVSTRWESIVGEPDPNQVEAMNRARELAGSLPAGSLERGLFERVSASVARTIERHKRQDEEWLDG
jgi:hypothetical protein